MPENWKSYICKVNDKLASIFVDMSLREHAPDLSRPHLLFVWVEFNDPRPDGFSTQGEFETLCFLEDALVGAVAKECNSVMPGRITTSGRREFYFYAPDASNFKRAVALGLSEFKQYKYRLGQKRDPSWSHYLQLLYPSDVQLQKISNREMLEVLKRAGDIHEIERDVSHWVYFAPEGDRESFKREIENLGYSIDSENPTEEEDRFCLVFVKKQAMTPGEIDKAVIELFEIAKRHNCEYDGWETQVVTTPESPMSTQP